MGGIVLGPRTSQSGRWARSDWLLAAVLVDDVDVVAFHCLAILFARLIFRPKALVDGPGAVVDQRRDLHPTTARSLRRATAAVVEYSPGIKHSDPTAADDHVPLPLSHVAEEVGGREGVSRLYVRVGTQTRAKY